MDSLELTTAQQIALEQNHGFVQGRSYVLMTTDLYRELVGVGSDDEFTESLEAVNQAMQDIQAGRTIPLAEASRRLDEKYDVHE